MMYICRGLGLEYYRVGLGSVTQMSIEKLTSNHKLCRPSVLQERHWSIVL